MLSIDPETQDLAQQLQASLLPGNPDINDSFQSEPQQQNMNLWPSEAAENVKLQPILKNKQTLLAQQRETFKKYSESDEFHITYKREKNKFYILHGLEGEIVDIFSPLDIIGANLEITFNTAGSTDLEEKSDSNQEHEKESILTQEQQETQGSSLQPAAFLNIYSYPPKPSRKGIFKKFMECIGPQKHEKINTGQGEEGESIIEDNIEEHDNTLMGRRYEHHRRFQIGTCEDFSDARDVVRAIRHLAKLGHYNDDENKTSPLDSTGGQQPRVQKYLVIVNPFSGTKTGKPTYERIVKKMLEECGVEHDVLFTDYAGHARDRAMDKKSNPNSNDDEISSEKDLSEYDAIIAMGGDGILHEIFQGIQTREDCDALLSRLKFGIVGCGTSNGLAAAVLHESKEHYGVLESTFLICKGNTSKIDLSTYETEGGKYLSFLTFSWAIISDIDIESEVVRFLGILRNDVWAAWRWINLKKYKAKFSYLPPVKEDSTKADGTSSVCPSLDTAVSSPPWVTIEDDFILFWVSHVSHAASNVIQSPDSKLQDGIFRIMVVRKNCSRMDLLGILLGFESGSHVNYRGVEFYECTAFRLEPITSGSYNDLDGEVIESGPVQAHVMPSATNIFSNV